MTLAGTPVANDLLTYSTLRLGGGLSAPSIAKLIHALQRVPGVLTAEVDAANTRAFVAHDVAVPAASLIAAAISTGAAANLIADTRVAPAPRTAEPSQAAMRRRLFMNVWIGIIVVVALIEIAIPTTPQNERWLLIVPVVSFWGFIAVNAFINRRR